MNFRRRWFLGGAAVVPAAALGARGGRAAASELETSLAAELAKVGLFDAHEHLIPERDRVSQPADFFTLAGHYALDDVVSAGLAGDALTTVRNPKASPQERWAAFEPHWKAARFTGYGRALSIAIADIYGFEEISAATLPRINEAIAGRNKPGLYDEVLRRRANIDWCLVDTYWNPKPTPVDRPYFLLAQKFDGFITPSSRRSLAALEQISGVSIASLGDLKRALEATFTQGLEARMATVKSTLAYSRSLYYQEVSERDAATDFDRMTKGDVEWPGGFRSRVKRPLKRLEDHMFHHLVRLVEAHGFTFQIHTGLPAGNSGFIENTRPTLLTNLFHLYPRVKFDLFHIGYPYEHELGVLGKLFRNVYPDFCWAHVISPPGSRRTLDEYLETVPVNKILGFGGDYRYPELTYAHAKMARRNIVQVLAAKVEAGLFTENQAVEVGRMLLRENAMHLFGIKAG